MEHMLVHYLCTILAIFIICGWVFVWFMHLLALFHGYVRSRLLPLTTHTHTHAFPFLLLFANRRTHHCIRTSSIGCTDIILAKMSTAPKFLVHFAMQLVMLHSNKLLIRLDSSCARLLRSSFVLGVTIHLLISHASTRAYLLAKYHRSGVRPAGHCFIVVRYANEVARDRCTLVRLAEC